MAAVSVIIPTYNRAHTLGRAIQSVFQQSHTDWELIVVDDGSTDHTPQVIASLPPGIEYLSHVRNHGVSAARNTGIRRSAAPLIAFLDSDDYWLPRKLAEQVRFFQDHPEALICQTEEYWIRSGRRVNPKKRHQKPSGEIFEPSLELCLVSPSAVMLRRELLDEVGLFDEDLPVCEDYDLWLRIACQHPVPLIPQPLVVKAGGHADQLSARYRGMDRFRIQALVKLLQRPELSKGQQEAVQETLRSKCRIYGQGCLKRGREEEGNFYLRLPELVRQGGAPASFPPGPR